MARTGKTRKRNGTYLMTERLPLQEQIDALRDDMKRILNGMADFETRTSLLEGLHTPSDASLNNPQEDVPEELVVIDYATMGDVDKVRVLLVDLRNRLNEHTDKKRTNKYTIL